MPLSPFAERTLARGVYAGIALLLLTPLVATPWTVFPFTVGKALYARVLVEVLFALWAVLALARPAYRAPRSGLLLLLGAGVAVALLAGAFGASWQRSLWSTYMRMQGVVDLAHWFALALVLAAMVRGARGWRLLFDAQLGVGLAVAAIAVARYHELPLPLYAGLPEAYYPRIGGTLGNPTFLGGYLLVNALLGLGLVLDGFRPAPPPPKPRRRGRRRGPPQPATAAPGAPRALGALRAAAAGLSLWALTTTGSLGALAGLVAGCACAAAAYAVLGRSRRARRAAAAAVAALGALTLALGAVAVAALAAAPGAAPDYSDRKAAQRAANPLWGRATSVDMVGLTLGRRLGNWEAGLAGFAERPLLGFGPDNYQVAFARHADGFGERPVGRDHAHNKSIEEAATKGLAGLAAYLALWGLSFAVAVRAVRRAEPGERALAVFVGAALVAHFVQQQTLFSTAATSLQHIVLLAWLAGRETAPGAPRRRALLAAAPAWLGRPAPRVAAALAAVALAGAGLWANRSVHDGAAALFDAEASGSGRFMHHLERAVAAFEPLATFPRMLLFENVAPNWPVLSRRYPAEAARLLAWSEREAPAALAAEPDNWRLHHSLTRLYAAVAVTRPDYAARAERHRRRSRELAPYFDPHLPPVGAREARRRGGRR